MKLQNPLKYRKQCVGFTLVEILISMALMAIVLGGLYSGITFGFSTIHTLRDELRATQIMVEHLERARLYTWSQLNSTTFIPQGTFTEFFYKEDGVGQGTEYTKQLVVEPSPLTNSYAGNMVQVTINLEWKNGSRVNRRSMSTYVAKNGLQSYIVK